MLKEGRAAARAAGYTLRLDKTVTINGDQAWEIVERDTGRKVYGPAPLYDAYLESLGL